jgi:hypothetical protein
MPIRAERRALYPKNWPEISARVRQCAGQKCEFCGVNNHAWGYRCDEGRFHEIARESVECNYGRPPFWLGANRVIQIVLTVAHLDHDETNCDLSNLRALCQRCHLRYDAKHHAKNAAAKRRSAMATRDMFTSAPPPTAPAPSCEPSG